MKYFVAIRLSIVIVLSIAALPNLTLGFEVYGAHQLSVAGDSNAAERERLKCLDEARAVDDEAHYKKFMSCANDSDLQDEFGFEGPQPEKIFYAPRSEDKYAIQIDVDLGLQKMVVRSPDRDQVVSIHSGRMNYETETKAKVTPEKYCFQADSAEPLHKAKHFHNALMPHSIFFSNGVAIHELADGTLGLILTVVFTLRLQMEK